MIIGNFTYDQKADTFTGDIATLTFSRSDVQIKPVKKSGEKGPVYRVYGRTGSGQVEFGSVWKRTSKKGGEFLSVELDAPTLDGALYAALFTAANGTTAELVWSRPTKGKAKAE